MADATTSLLSEIGRANESALNIFGFILILKKSNVHLTPVKYM
jgi:hypothetical protein